MKSILIGEKKLSNMTLGTVQLGMNYGIANTTGQPAEEESFAMLGAALKGGVSSIDTARVYGNSEDVIGHFFRQYDGELPFITTKVPKIMARCIACVLLKPMPRTAFCGKPSVPMPTSTQ